MSSQTGKKILDKRKIFDYTVSVCSFYRIIYTLIAVAPLLFRSASGGWFSNWPYRFYLSNRAACGNETLTNFPFLIFISNNTELSAYAMANGNDILFTDFTGTNRLSHETEYYTNGTLWAWVNMPRYYYNSSKSNNFYIYFGTNTAGSMEEKTNVWDSNYLCVFHLNEEFAGTGNSDIYKDSTRNLRHADDFVADTQTMNRIYKSHRFSNDYALIGATGLPLANKFTLSAWIYPEQMNIAGGHKIIACYQTVPANREWMLDVYSSGRTRAGISSNGTANELSASATAVINVREWQMISATYSGQTGILSTYKNGVIVSSAPVNTSAVYNSGNQAVIGMKAAGAGEYFRGYIDETRISDIDRSSNWLLTSFSNQHDPQNQISIGSFDEYGIPQVAISAASSPPAIAGQKASFLITADTTGNITNIYINFGDGSIENHTVNSSSVSQVYFHTYNSGDTFLLSAAATSDVGKIRTNQIYITPAPYSMPAAAGVETIYLNEGLKLKWRLPSINQIRRVVIYRNSLQLAGISPVSSDMEYLDRYLFYNTAYTYQIGIEYPVGMVLSSNIVTRPFCLELAQKIIGSSGGSIGNLFSELVIPPGALPGDTLVKLIVSSNLLYNFEPGYAQAYNQVRIETEPPSSFASNARLSLLAPFIDNKIHLMPDDGNYDRIFTGSENRLTISSYNNRAWIPAYSRVYDKNVLPNLNYKILIMDISDGGIFGVGIILNTAEYENKVTVKNRVFAPQSSYSAMSKVTIFFPNSSFEEVTLQIYSMSGKKIYERFIGGSAGMVSWDGLSDSGRMSDSGLYIAAITKGGRIKNSYRVQIYLVK